MRRVQEILQETSAPGRRGRGPKTLRAQSHRELVAGARGITRISGGTNFTRREHNMTYVIALPCVDVKDRSCIDECPVDCIYEGDRMLYIQPDECVDCGACVPVCPVEAIYYEDDVPEKWAEYYTVNVDFFSELGSPGGAAKTGPCQQTTHW